MAQLATWLQRGMLLQCRAGLKRTKQRSSPSQGSDQVGDLESSTQHPACSMLACNARSFSVGTCPDGLAAAVAAGAAFEVILKFGTLGSYSFLRTEDCNGSSSDADMRMQAWPYVAAGLRPCKSSMLRADCSQMHDLKKEVLRRREITGT